MHEHERPDTAELTTLGQGRFLRLLRRGTWEFVERTGTSGAAVIVAVTDDRKLLLVEQPRPALGVPVFELPAGLVGDEAGKEDEEVAAAAGRELVEETGFEAAEIELVAEGPTTAGLSSERVAMFLATGLKRVGPGGGTETEQITVHEVPLAEVEAFLREQVARGRAVDLKIYAALHFARRLG
jgi:ADP-ribose pyrophosphatase